jgi:bifunctional UDP-N-acetylglucosamine pyrophosphorylase / glucosamine-1-phosphate N-acetyltransferase
MPFCFDQMIMAQPLLHIIVLAAGRGTRMGTHKLKILHEVCGKSLVQHVVAVARELNPEQITVVHGPGGASAMQAHLKLPEDLAWVLQAQARGTGDAVACAITHIPDEAQLLILAADVPLISAQALQQLVQQAGSGLALLTTTVADAAGFGRVVRDDLGEVIAVVESKDASEQQQQINEINTGIMTLPAAMAKALLPQIQATNAQQEYYLTDLIALAREAEYAVVARHDPDWTSYVGVNTLQGLAWAEKIANRRCALSLMQQGVHIIDPERFDCRGEVIAAADVVIDVGVILKGRVELAPGVRIGAYSVLEDVVLSKDVIIEPHSVMTGVCLHAQVRVGPFAYLRPGTQLLQQSKVGAFVEVKNTTLGPGSKANHLSYLGDAVVGTGVNLGAGTVTCNYDGRNKHQTVIEDHVFVGSGTELVAPINIGAGAFIAAGSVVHRDVTSQSLVLSSVSSAGYRQQVTRSLPAYWLAQEEA